MTILTITKRGAIRLPKELVQQLKGTRHFQVKVSAGGITLMPVQIQLTVDLRAIPAERPQSPK